MTREGNIFNYIHILVKWRKFIILNFVIVCILAAGISLILPKWYTATTTILPPEEQTYEIGLPSMMANLPLGGINIPGITTPGAIYVAILESRTVREGVIRKQGLLEIFKSRNMEEAVNILLERTNIAISDEGIIELRVTARTPQRAADIANTYIEEMDRKNTELNVAQAMNNRVFIEERLSENKEALRIAEENLRQFQEKHKAISLPEQTAMAIEGAAKVIGEIQALEVKRDVMLATMKLTNPKVVQVQTQIDALQKQLDRMEFGIEDDLETANSGQANRKKEIYVPFAKVPSVGLELARLTRELKIQEVIFELLTSQYEQAKIQEAKDTPTVQVLDPAVPPVKRSKPHRKMIVLLSGAFALLLSCTVGFTIEYYERKKKTGQEEYETIRAILDTVRNDFSRMKSKLMRQKYK